MSLADEEYLIEQNVYGLPKPVFNTYLIFGIYPKPLQNPNSFPHSLWPMSHGEVDANKKTSLLLLSLLWLVHNIWPLMLWPCRDGADSHSISHGVSAMTSNTVTL